MLDAHSHVLYDIDDGSRSLEMSLEMLRMAVASGTNHILATPHVNRKGIIPSWDVIQEKVTALQDEADKAEIPITIHTGAEVEINYEALEFLQEGGGPYCLAGTKYILCELTNQSEPRQTGDLLFELTMRGYRPILAHPERYDRIMEQPETIWKWMEKGILTQCNGGSFHGYFGAEVQRRVELLASKQMISLLGSDAHRVEFRHADLREPKEAIGKLPNGEVVLETCRRNGEKLLQKKMIYPDLLPWEEPKQKKGGFFQRLFGKG